MKNSHATKQFNLRMDEPTYEHAFEIADRQAIPMSQVLRKLICLWATNQSLQKKVRLTDIQSLVDIYE